MRCSLPLRFLRFCSLGMGVAFASIFASPARADDAPFDVRTIPESGRTVAAEIADLDGDGRLDLLTAVFHDLPPDERRVLLVRLQRPDGSLSDTPDDSVALPDGVAAYDLSDVDGLPGAELILLRPHGLSVLDFARGEGGGIEPRWRELPVPGGYTLGAAADERGFDPLRMVSRDFGPEPWLVVPGLGETFFLASDGALRAHIDSGSRANYFVQPPGPTLGESDIQLYLDAPRISVGDVNGDGRVDIAASSRHELRLFFRGDGGAYARVPDTILPLRRVTLEDHIRGSGSVRSIARDLDGDGLLDLVLSLTAGGLMNASSATQVFVNRGAGWDLDRADVTFASPKTLSADQLVDLDGDGRVELVRMGIPIGVLELIEIFLQRSLDARLEAYRIEHAPALTGSVAAAPQPVLAQKVAVPIDLDISRLAGFLPTLDFDVNGDGLADYLGGSDGTRFEILLGGPGTSFGQRIEQPLVTAGQLRSGDLNGDNLPDFVLFNSRRVDEPVRIAINRGVLPGTPERTVIEAPPD